MRLFENILALYIGRENFGMRTFACTVLAAILIAAPLTLCAAGGASRDKALLAARDAFLAGDRVKLARQAEKIRGHVLEPYVGYWRLRLQHRGGRSG